MNTFQKKQIAAIVLRHRPDLTMVADKLGASVLTNDERELLRETLADELCAEGLNSDGEPNARGLIIEGLIDALGGI